MSSDLTFADAGKLMRWISELTSGVVNIFTTDAGMSPRLRLAIDFLRERLARWERALAHPEASKQLADAPLPGVERRMYREMDDLAQQLLDELAGKLARAAEDDPDHLSAAVVAALETLTAVSAKLGPEGLGAVVWLCDLMGYLLPNIEPDFDTDPDHPAWRAHRDLRERIHDLPDEERLFAEFTVRVAKWEPAAASPA